MVIVTRIGGKVEFADIAAAKLSVTKDDENYSKWRLNNIELTHTQQLEDPEWNALNIFYLMGNR